MSDNNENNPKTTIPLIEKLITLYPDSSKRTLLTWIEFGRILVDGKAVKRKETPIQIDQKITLLPKEGKKIYGNIRIIYKDRWIVVIDKPADLLSVPLDERTEDNALDLTRDFLETSSLFAVHRLDREASGLLLFARGTVAEQRMEKLFEEHTIKRHYLAIVEGKMMQRQGTWTSYLEEKENFDVVTVPEGRGKLAITHYERLYVSKFFSYLHLQLETGRKHQIRVHASEAGHPLLGDKRYGSTLNPLHRLALHAFKLEFTHPFTRKRVSLFSPLPWAFSKIVPETLTNKLKSL